MATFGGHSIAFTASDYCLLTKSAFDRIFEDSCGFEDIENAITDAAKAAYLATLIQYGINGLVHYNGDLTALANMSVNTLANKLNKIKLSNPEAFYYWCKTDAILPSIL